MILDSAEHLARNGETPRDTVNAASDVVNAVLAGAPRVKVVVTTRVRLNVLGEHLYPVKPLAYPETDLGVQGAGAYAAVQLFVQSARRLRPTFSLSDRNVEAVVGVCRYVRGLPLALMLTSTWTPVMGVWDILGLLKGDGGQALDVLRTDWRNVAPRHRDIRVVYEHSWQLLGEPAQQLGQALSVFEGEFTLSDIVGATGARLHDFRALVDAAFVERTPQGLYVMHDLVREFVLEKVARDPVAERRLRSRHSRFYVAALHRWAADLKGPQQQAALSEMDRAIANITLAWQWAVAEGDVGAVDQGLEGLRLYLSRRVRQGEAARLSRAAVDRLGVLHHAQVREGRDGNRVLARVLTWNSTFLPTEEAQAALARALSLLGAAEAGNGLDVRVAQAAALLRLGEALGDSDREAAERCHDEALSLSREAGDAWLEAAVLRSQAALAWGLGQFPRSTEYHEASLAIARELGDLQGIARSVSGLCRAASTSGRAEYAMELARGNLDVLRALDDKAELAAGLYILAITHMLGGRAGEAIPWLEESVAIKQDDLGLPAGREISMLSWAWTLSGNYKAAHRLAVQAQPLLCASGSQRLVAWGQFVLGCISVALTAYDEAGQLLTEGVRSCRLLNQRMDLAWGLSVLAYVRCAQGSVDRAEPLVMEALPIGFDIGSPQAQAFALVGSSLIALHRGDVLRSVELYALASTRSACPENCAWFWDVAKQYIDAAATSLPATQVAASEERGRALDVRATVSGLVEALTRNA